MANLNDLRDDAHEANKRWWQDPRTGRPFATEKERLGMAQILLGRTVYPDEALSLDGSYIKLSIRERDLICEMLTTHARNKGELLMLVVSEIAEAMEGVRKNLPDDKLPHRTMEEVELADALIRIFDYAGGFGLDLEGAYREKMFFNSQRRDHTHEARLAPDGKRF